MASMKQDHNHCSVPPVREQACKAEFINCGFYFNLKRCLHIFERGEILMRIKALKEKNSGMNYLPIVIYMLLCSLAVNAHAEGCGANTLYEGKGAGQVLFDGQFHASKGLSCSDCHEGNAFSFALFEMKRGATKISMRNMELGRSCGSCHDGKQAFSATDSLNCSKCHQK